MPLFKLLELLETRYHSNVSMSEVNKLKDICEITEDTDGRVVSLTPEVRCSPPLNIGRVGNTRPLYLFICCVLFSGSDAVLYGALS